MKKMAEKTGKERGRETERTYDEDNGDDLRLLAPRRLSYVM